jgi:4-aminobutyrate aminotransferase-like enzyme
MRSVVRNGIGDNSPADIQPDYGAALAVADDPNKLIDLVNLVLTYGTMRPDTMSAIREAVTSVTINAANPTPGRQNRVYLAALFAMSAPEFIVQK